jgi:hypothetical protein
MRSMEAIIATQSAQLICSDNSFNSRDHKEIPGGKSDFHAAR